MDTYAYDVRVVHELALARVEFCWRCSKLKDKNQARHKQTTKYIS